MIIGLIIILLLVLFLPFTKVIGRNLELFLLVTGVISAIISQVLDWELITIALVAPINITLAVFAAGLIFRWFQKTIEKEVLSLSYAMPFRLFIALFVIILGLISSLITAIISAIILVAVATVLKMDRKSETRFVILSCFSIGFGAALTPIGEPLSTITVAKLNVGFFYLLNIIGIYIIPGIIIFGVLAGLMIAPRSEMQRKFGDDQIAFEQESYGEIIWRSFKVYLFVMALTFLGVGFQPFIEHYLFDLHPLASYWINMISAILDNATLAAAEISPAMSQSTIKAILLGLIVSGGMLIPGNIPNIIAAQKLNISSLEYARFAVPVGLVGMVAYFIVILFTL